MGDFFLIKILVKHFLVTKGIVYMAKALNNLKEVAAKTARMVFIDYKSKTSATR